MPTINQLPLLSQPSSGDQIPVYSQNNGDARRMPLSNLLEYFQDQFTAPGLTTYLMVPTSGFNYSVPDPVTQNIWVIFQPLTTLANGTLTLPTAADTPDGTEILVTTTQQITSFTTVLNGALNAFGIPLTLAAEDFFRLRYFAATTSWYRVA